MVADFWEIAAVFFAVVREIQAVPEWHNGDGLDPQSRQVPGRERVEFRYFKASEMGLVQGAAL